MPAEMGVNSARSQTVEDSLFAESRKFRLSFVAFTQVQIYFYATKENKYCVHGEWESQQSGVAEVYLTSVVK